jgi:phospholipase/carboxylesterase
MRKQRFGGLLAYTTGGTDGVGGGDGPVVILLHGFGAPGFDLVDLGSMLDVPDQTRFVFPEAPLVLDSGPGRAWWMLDMEFFERRARGERIDRSADIPESLAERSEQLTAFVDEVGKQLGVGPERMVIGGFSQGSMLACDYVLHAQRKPAGLILFSSTLLALPRWQPVLGSCSGLKVFQSHGHQDPILPFEDSERLRDLLIEAGCELRFVAFPGGHALPGPALLGASQLIRDALYAKP